MLTGEKSWRVSHRGIEPDVLVFAYGSNMYSPRMRSRVSTATLETVGYVRQRKLVFHKRSDDGSAKADAPLTDSPTDRVWGVVYRLPSHKKPLLDQHEFLGVGYDEEMVDVGHENGVVRAWMYVARPDAINASLLPYSWYHDFVILGAREHRLPERYIDYVRTFNTLDDPDAVRHSANRRLVQG